MIISPYVVFGVGYCEEYADLMDLFSLVGKYCRFIDFKIHLIL